MAWISHSPVLRISPEPDYGMAENFAAQISCRVPLWCRRPPSAPYLTMSDSPSPSQSPIARNLPTFIACVAMAIAFFMPWLTFFGLGVSGNSMGQIGGEGQLAWGVFILAVLAGVMHLVSPSKLFNVLAGVVPFALLFYYASKMGKDLFQVLGPGAYLTLISGLVLVVAPVKAGASKG